MQMELNNTKRTCGCARHADDSRKCHCIPDPDAQAFKAYVKMVLTRKNTITGVMYSEDPGTPERLSAPLIHSLMLAFLQPCPKKKYDWVCTVCRLHANVSGWAA